MLFYGMAIPDNPYDVVHIEFEVSISNGEQLFACILVVLSAAGICQQSVQQQLQLHAACMSSGASCRVENLSCDSHLPAG